MEFETLIVKTEGPIGRLILNLPERLNALGPTIMHELTDAAHWFDRQSEVRVVIVSGAGRAFSAGADLLTALRLRASPEGSLQKDTAASPEPPSWQKRREGGQVGLRMADALEQMHAVTIARIQGYAVGGGVVLAAVCDLRVAAEDAVFFIPEVELGLPLAWGGIPRLVREIGPALTKELVMTGRRFSPAEAKAAGFVNRVVPAADLDAEVEALAQEIAAKPVVPVIITKEHVNAVARQIAGATAYADGDVLQATSAAEESRDAGRAYRERAFSRPKSS